MTFSNELIIGVALGILITGIVLYLILMVEPHHPIKKLINRIYQWFEGDNLEPPPASIVKAHGMQLSKNLNQSTVHLDLEQTLKLLAEYQENDSPELLLHLQEHLKKHTADGNNALHEYISHHDADVEVVREMVEIEPELLTEENVEGETALHLSVEHDHQEISEFLMESERFDTPEAHHAFLQHHDHAGHTALHDAAHLWHYHPQHVVEMIEKHPVGSLLWKDKEGKTVYEHFFEHQHTDRKKLVEALIHKGVLQEHNGHLEIPAHIRKEIVKEAGIKTSKNLAELALLVKQYASSHHATVETQQPKEENTLRGIKRTNRPHPE